MKHCNPLYLYLNILGVAHGILCRHTNVDLYLGKVSKLSAQAEIINIAGFVDRTGCFTTTQLCFCHRKAVHD